MKASPIYFLGLEYLCAYGMLEWKGIKILYSDFGFEAT